MKKRPALTAVLLAAILTLSACAAGTSTSPTPDATVTDENGVKVPNPLQTHTDFVSARMAVGFDFLLPNELPEGYQLKIITTIDGEVADIEYQKGADTICYRTAEGISDISGNFNTFTQTETLDVDGTAVEMRGENNTCSQAVWSKDEVSYAMSFSDPVTAEQLTEIVKSIV